MKTLLLALLLVPAPFQQQAVHLSWEYDTTPATVATWTQTVVVNGNTVTAAPVCGPLNGGSRTQCIVPITLNPTGNNITVSASNQHGTSTANIQNLNLNQLPLLPQNPKATITITIQIGGE